MKENSPVRIQWDPERDLQLEPQRYRSIQIGLGKAAVDLYINSWIERITEITDLAHAIHGLVSGGLFEQAEAALPIETPYPYNDQAL